MPTGQIVFFRTKPKLDRIESFLKRVVRENKLPAAITATLTRREALKDVDYLEESLDFG